MNISVDMLLGQLALGLVNGSFYAILSLGLAVIFGMLNIINFAHGAFYMWGPSSPSYSCSLRVFLIGSRCSLRPCWSGYWA